MNKARKSDTRFIAALPAREQATIKRHIVYTLKKRGGYSKENVAIAMKGRVCDVY